MLIIRVMIFVGLLNVLNSRYSLYYSDIRQDSYVIFDCLYAQLIEHETDPHVPYIRISQLTPYCRRPDNDEKQETISDILDKNLVDKISFDELREQGVTSEQLLNWSASIDLAERYEINNKSSQLFYNCSSPWFGSKCQYKFVNNLSLSFNEIIESFEKSRLYLSTNMSTTTCYRFLPNCDRKVWSLCLDWRQICDRKIDCINGEDEQWCETLEISKCDHDQYRCHYGGQCIPMIFVRDSPLSVDCLDGSEEMQLLITSDESLQRGRCGTAVTFGCRERINRYSHSFPCGDGLFSGMSALPASIMGCGNRRDQEVGLAMLTSFDHIQDIKCRQAFRCSLLSNRSYSSSPQLNRPSHEYFEGSWDKDCELLSNSCFDEWLLLPGQPIMYGFFQFVYWTNRSINEFKNNVAPDFVCFDAQKCPNLLSKIIPIEIIAGLTCCNTSDLTMDNEMKHFHMINDIFRDIYKQCLTIGNEISCENSSYFYCNKSLKCISYDRVGDGFTDCYYDEDEAFSACQFNDTKRFKCKSDSTKCLMHVAIGNRKTECREGEDEREESIYGINLRIPFPVICRGDPQFGIEETENTNCDWWPCDNPYSHCDGAWDCLNGIDELNCPDTYCSSNEFQCKNEDFNLTFCLPLTHMFYKRVDDCTNARFIRELYFDNGTRDISESYYSFNKSKCIREDNICSGHLETANIQQEICLKNRIPNSVTFWNNDIYKIDNNKTYLCALNLELTRPRVPDSYKRFLIPSRLGYFPSRTSNTSVENFFNKNKEKEIIPEMDPALAWYCHYGFPILFGGVNQTKTCLCPPNYFGSQCQWQSQRVSLTIHFKIQGMISSRVIFQVIIMLIDEQGIIQPNSEQITYMPAYECNTKFNIYLLYPHRPKHSSGNYSIRIDLFDKSTLDYWTSWYLLIPFYFLPVNRIATQLIIPEFREKKLCTLPCGEHGQCMRYTNMNNVFFCRCDQGYSGSFCNMKHECQCSNDSFCLASFICVCRLDKFGLRCYLKRSICQSKNNPCEHDGFCIPIDDRINLHAFICVCKQGYHGERCQYKSNQIDIYIDDTIKGKNSLFFIHFITAFDQFIKHQRTTLLKKIAFGSNTITTYLSQPFHIVLVEIPDGDYYLIALRERFIQSEYIHSQLLSKQRCSSVDDLLNETFRGYQYLRRVKYYPLLCRQYSQLMCFYDEFNMCICDSDRFSNCFQFNHTIKYDCNGRDRCNKNGQCFQNNETCPTSFHCVCEDCYYGAQCNLTTKGLIFSLDSILGYHIKPNVSINKQPFIVKFTIGITLIMLIAGLISGSLSLATFLSSKTREVGCGYYLLLSSISSICMIILLTIKVCYLILSQMSLITNRSLLFVNCVSIEIILKLSLSLSEWLNACVAIERMFSVLKGVKFDKNKSKTRAKQISWILIILLIVTHIHDPLHRELIDDGDGDQQRIWCLEKYSSSLTKYNTFIILADFLAPFSINVISALLLIVVAARSRSKIESKQTFNQHFLSQLQQHKHILISPLILVLLCLPRLIISFTSGCMKSPQNSWLYFIGYFLSFIPSMLTFFVFVLPSKTYKKEFDKTMQQWTRRFYRKPSSVFM